MSNQNTPKHSGPVKLDPPKLVVESATLQAAVMLPGGKTEHSLNQAKIPGIEMTWIKGEGLLVKVQGKEAMIPATNVKIAHFKQAARMVEQPDKQD